MMVKMKVVGPTVTEIKNNISVTVTADETSTAVEGDHYRIENLPLVLTPDQNFLGELEIILMSEGNAAPMDGTPEFEDYEAPVLVLNVAATGDPNVEQAVGNKVHILLILFRQILMLVIILHMLFIVIQVWEHILIILCPKKISIKLWRL